MHSLKLELIDDDFLAVRVKVFVDDAHHLVEPLASQIRGQVIVDFPDLRVAGAVVLLEPLVPGLAAALNVSPHCLVHV